MNGGGRLADYVSDFAGASEAREQICIGHGLRMYDNVARHSTIFSDRHCARNSVDGCMERVATKLKNLREQTRPKLSVREVAARLGMPLSSYSFYESKKYKKPILPFDLVKKLATIFAGHGVDKNEVYALAGLTNSLVESSISDRGEDWVTTVGKVAAGVWREQSYWSPSERYDVRFGPPPFEGAERFGLQMEGLSMNKIIQPGTDLEVLRVPNDHISPAAGQLVIVERLNHGLSELTCKRLDIEDGEWVLRCESHEDEFQGAIRIGAPDADTITDDSIRVVGIVLSAKLDTAPAGLSTRRYRQE